MSLNLRSILNNNNKLMGPNFLDWLHVLRNVLKLEKLGHILEGPLLPSLVVDALDFDHMVHMKYKIDNDTTSYLMLDSMSPKLHILYKAKDTYSII